jgi:catechol 2,3-dioxygenase-like lactoylglutathione lyase family enzyme
MKIEHIAFMVADPAAVAQWYVKHLGFTIKRASTTPPFGHFLADGSGTVMIELYDPRNNPRNDPRVKVPDYRGTDSVVLHLAFQVDDVARARQRLMAAGATPEGDIARTPDGDELTMLRDPWGFAIQLARRAKPMV